MNLAQCPICHRQPVAFHRSGQSKDEEPLLCRCENLECLLCHKHFLIAQWNRADRPLAGATQAPDLRDVAARAVKAWDRWDTDCSGTPPAGWIRAMKEMETVLAGSSTEAGGLVPRPVRALVEYLDSQITSGKVTEIEVTEEFIAFLMLAKKSLLAAGPQYHGIDLDAAVDAEPELPGPIPAEMYAALQGDPDACAEACRIIVRQTKAGIKARVAEIRRLLAQGGDAGASRG